MMLELLREQIAGNEFLSGGAVLMVMGAAAALLRNLPARLWSWITHRVFIEFEIPMRDEAFWWFDEWLAKHAYGQHRARWLTVRTVNRGRRTGDRAMVVLSPAPGIHWLFWRGRLMIVTRDRREMGNDSNGYLPERESFRVRILTRDRSDITAIIEEAREVVSPESDTRVTVYTPEQFHNGWLGNAKCRYRPLDSVVLRRGVMESIISRVRHFIEGESWYIERGIPYRYGCLLHGPPGTGKSSTVLAVASHLKLDIAIINLADFGLDDAKLRHLMATVPQDCIVLIEDVDCAFAKREGADDKRSKVTFSGLLNAIDGVAAGEGRVLFLTSNHPELLDPALVRPGRCDDRLYLGNADSDQARRMFLRFFPGADDEADSFAAQVNDDEISMAELQGHLSRHASNIEMAVQLQAVASS